MYTTLLNLWSVVLDSDYCILKALHRLPKPDLRSNLDISAQDIMICPSFIVGSIVAMPSHQQSHVAPKQIPFVDISPVSFACPKYHVTCLGASRRISCGGVREPNQRQPFRRMHHGFLAILGNLESSLKLTLHICSLNSRLHNGVLIILESTSLVSYPSALPNSFG